MQEKIIGVLEGAQDWLTEDAIADKIGARSVANVALHLKGMGNRVVSRKSPTEKYPGTNRPKVEWRHADYANHAQEAPAPAPDAEPVKRRPRRAREAIAATAVVEPHATIAGHKLDDVVRRLEDLKSWNGMAERLGCTTPQEVAAKLALTQEELAQMTCAANVWKTAAEKLEKQVAALKAEAAQVVDVKDVAIGYRLRAGSHIMRRKRADSAAKTAQQMARQTGKPWEVIAEVRIGTARPFTDAKYIEVKHRPKPAAIATESEGGHPD